jgi:hypothetical protein
MIGILAGFVVPASGQGNVFIKGLAPDWNQPLNYPDPFDPLNGPMAGDPYWKAWCAPTAGACLIGHWEDVKGRNGLADGSADGNQAKAGGYAGPAWGAGPAWHDYSADGIAGAPGPNPMRGSRPVDDLGVYLDTNGHISTILHGGTWYKDLAPGLNQFFSAKGTGFGQPAENLQATTWGVNPVFGAWNLAQMAAALKIEVDNNRTAIAHFRHWNLMPAGPPAGPGTGDEKEEKEFDIEEYYFGDYVPGGNDEEWNGYDDDYGLGHAVLVVGYFQNAAGVPTHLVVHDNWPGTGRNVMVPICPQLAAITLVQVSGNQFIKGLAPDWNQPLDYPDIYDIFNGPAAGDPFWNAWCVPTAAACLIGYWEDVKARAGLSDGSADGNQSIPLGYGGPAWGAGPAWHDYTADGNAAGLPGPNPLRGSRPVDDLGVYLDTQGHMTGMFHGGTWYKDVAPGLRKFLRAKGTGPGQPARKLTARTLGVHPQFGQLNPSFLSRMVKREVDRNRPVIAHFRHWNLVPSGPPAVPGTGNETDEAEFDIEAYKFDEWTGMGGHDEEWNNYEGLYGLGHAVLVVGYTLDMTGKVTHFIVHDNWPSTGRNVQVPVGFELVAVTLVRSCFIMSPQPGF